jgi:hypothetical protein
VTYDDELRKIVFVFYVFLNENGEGSAKHWVQEKLLVGRWIVIVDVASGRSR